MNDVNLITFLQHLVKHHGEPCLSLYMSTHRVTARKPKDRIFFKNLLKEANNLLIEQGMRRVEIKNFLAPTLQLYKDTLFWEYLGRGLALFLSSHFFEYFISSVSFETKVYIGNRFYLKSLLPILYRGKHFFLLTLSRKETRLFRVTRSIMEDIFVKDSPQGLSHRSLKRQPYFHTGSHQRKDKQAAPLIGHGLGPEEEKPGLIQYCQQLDGIVSDFLKNEKAPLMLIGLNYLISIYRQVNTYPYLAEDSISANPSSYSHEDLHRLASTAMESYLMQWREEVLTRFKSGENEGRICTDVAPLLQAASEGRVELLFVSLDTQLYARHDLESGRVDLHTEYHVGDVDILDEIVVRTLLSGGEVYGLEDAEIPLHLPLAALIRHDQSAIPL